MRWLLLAIALSVVHSQAYSQSGDSQRTQEQRGTDNNPLTEKILPTPNANTQTAKEEEYRRVKAEEDKELAHATVWLARITAALAIFTAALWWSARKLV